MMEQELFFAGFSDEDKKMRARQLAAQMEMHMLTASPSRAAYDALIQRACEYDAEFESEALTYFQYSLAMYKAVLQKDPMSWIREHDAAVFPPPVYAAERIYRLTGEKYGKHDNRTLCALREWADMMNSSEDFCGWRIYPYLENAWRDLRHTEGRFDEAQQFAVLLGRALLKAGEGQLSLKVFEKVYNEETDKRGAYCTVVDHHKNEAAVKSHKTGYVDH